MVENVTYLIPVDSFKFKKSVISEELLNHIIHGRQKDVTAYNYSALEVEGERFANNLTEVMEMYDD